MNDTEKPDAPGDQHAFNVHLGPYQWIGTFRSRRPRWWEKAILLGLSGLAGAAAQSLAARIWDWLAAHVHISVG